MAGAARHLVAASLVAVLVAGMGCGGTERSTVERIVDAPAEHHGERVTIETVVSRRIDHRVWEVADGRILVIYDRGLARAPRPPDRFRVTGTVLPLEKEAIEVDAGVDIEDHFFTDDFLDDDAALVADEVSRIG